MRVGFGYDVHAFAEGRRLILGGQEIPYERGLLGHSDADVVTHAIIDALLGAAAMGDIGRHFPDTDDAYRGADSMLLLKKTMEMLLEKGYVVENIDATIIAQKPKLAPYMEAMVTAYCSLLGLESDRVNVKATTTEKLGFTGREEGIAACAVCMIRRG